MTQGPFTIFDVQPVNVLSLYSYPKKLISEIPGSSHEEWDTGVWIDVAQAASSTSQPLVNGNAAQAFTASMTLPNKHTVPLTWTLCADPSALIALVNIPAGIPPSMKWFDLDLLSESGKHARWRISPAVASSPFKAVAFSEPPLPAEASVTGSVAVETDRGEPSGAPRCEMVIRQNQCETQVNSLRVQFENEPLNYTRVNNDFISFTSTDLMTQTCRCNPYAPFWKYAHRAALTTDFAMFKTMKETVVFRHVPLKKTAGKLVVAPDTATSLITPSGIKVTLMDAASQTAIMKTAEQKHDAQHEKTAVFYKVAVAPAPGQEGYPKSPLTIKYDIAPSVSGIVTGAPLNVVYADNAIATGANDPHATSCYFFPPLPSPAFIDIPVEVTERVDLGRYHVRIVVPIHAKA